jgi:hypothetical protein
VHLRIMGFRETGTPSPLSALLLFCHFRSVPFHQSESPAMVWRQTRGQGDGPWFEQDDHLLQRVSCCAAMGKVAPMRAVGSLTGHRASLTGRPTPLGTGGHAVQSVDSGGTSTWNGAKRRWTVCSAPSRCEVQPCPQSLSMPM